MRLSTLAGRAALRISPHRGMSIAASMGLPSSMSDATIATIKATAPVVAPAALEITKTFYKGLFEKNPGLLSIFNQQNQASGAQPAALAASVVAFASNIDQLQEIVGFPGSPVDVIAHTHCGLQVLPQHYPIVHDEMMVAIGTVLGPAVSPEIGSAWSEAVCFLAGVLIDAEANLYDLAAARSGGWRGFAPFEVTAVEQVTADVKSFRFAPTSLGASLDSAAGGFQFSPGQFLTLRVDLQNGVLTAPRHYTITSSPGEKTLECTIKKVPNGGVSEFMHEQVGAGSTVELSPPFGTFTPRDSSRKAVLVSAGIGVTPMLTIGKRLGSSVALVVHVDSAPAAHPYSRRCADLGAPTLFKYSSDGGKIPAEQLVTEIFAALGSHNPQECDFYLCASPGFQSIVKEALCSAGAKTIYSEAFKGHLELDTD